MIHEKGILKVWNSILDIEKDFKPCNVSADDVDGFKEKEISKTEPIKKFGRFKENNCDSC